MTKGCPARSITGPPPASAPVRIFGPWRSARIATGSVASVTVSPSSASVSVGSTYPFAATLKDAVGTVLTGPTVSWASSNGAVATVSGSGLVSGGAAGSATITATSGGVTGSASVTVTAPAPSSGGWPNEPAGFTVVTDYGFGDAYPYGSAIALSGGWTLYNTNNGGLITSASDATAPQSPPLVAQYTYPIGWPAGSGPGSILYDLSVDTKTAYFGFWWKCSNPWQTQTVGNKILFIKSANGTNQQFVWMDNNGHMAITTEYSTDNRNFVGSTVVTCGVWHRIEWYGNYSTGQMMLWLDGALQITSSGVVFPPDAGFHEFDFNPTWGGTGGTKTETDYFWFDHAHLSKP